jgi:DMSO/TMAO reductase YedYZ molybdopterin-dependent catalytic subunit
MKGRCTIFFIGLVLRAMPRFSRGFHGSRRSDVDAARVPPGQYVVNDFPVLSAGPTPSVPSDQWLSTVDRAVGPSRSWTWNEFTALPSETVTVDIHCVTKGSKLGTEWTAVSMDVLLDGIQTAAEYLTAHS